MASETLKPCPWCGRAPLSRWVGNGTPGMEDCGYWEIACWTRGECCMDAVMVHGESEEECIPRWNTRTADAELVEAARAFVAWSEGSNFGCADGDAALGLCLRRLRSALAKHGGA